MGNILVGLVLILMVSGVIVYLVRERKKGCSACGCDCGCCSKRCARNKG